MPETIVTAAVGVLICFFGIRNMMGDISSIHSYHRKRVKDEDVKPFGKRVGLGTFICGLAVLVMSLCTYLATHLANERFVFIGTAVLIVGLIVGCIISFFAMKKYNGGIF